MLKHWLKLVGEQGISMVPEGLLVNHFLVEKGKVHCCNEERSKLSAPSSNVKNVTILSKEELDQHPQNMGHATMQLS